MATPDLDFNSPFAAKVPFVIPARSSASQAITKLSIVPTASAESQALGSMLEARLIGLRYNEQLFYSPVILSDPVNAQVVPLSTLQAITVRDRTVGALSIAFAGQRFEQRNSQEQRTNCTDTNLKLFKSCPKGSLQTTQVSCEERTATVAVDVRMYDSVSKRIVLSEQVADKSSYKRCLEANGEPQIADAELAGRALAVVVNRVVSTIAPTTELRALEFMDPDASVTDPRVLRAFRAAQKFGEGKRLDEACARFTDLYDGNKESYSLTYNIAFCDEATGDLLRASTRYRRASDLVGAPNARIDRHLAQVEKAVKEIGIVAVSGGGERSDRNSGRLANTGKRVALVIGNSKYQRGALINPVNDAHLMEAQLRKLGFDVTPVENANSARLQTAVTDFAAKSRNADVALFYYAGHAQSSNGENFLIPVDNDDLRTTDEVSDKALHFSDVLAKLEVAGANVKLVILDSCRDSPLPSSTRSMAGGMAKIDTPPAGSVVLFATVPGQTVKDGDAANSIFTKAVAKAIQTPNVSIEVVFKQVQTEVARETKNKQKPMYLNMLVGDFYLRPTK